MYKREIFLLFFQLFYKSAHASGTRHFPRKVFSLVVHMKKKQHNTKLFKKYEILHKCMENAKNKNKKSIILGSLNWICWRDHWWVKSLYLIPSDNRFLFLMTDFTVSFNSSFIWLYLSLTLFISYLFLTLFLIIAASAKANFYLECFFYFFRSKTFYFSNKKPRRIYNLWPHSIFIRIVCCFIL